MGKVIPTLTNTTYITKILPQKCPKTTSKLPQNFWICSDPPPFGGFEAKKKCLKTFESALLWKKKLIFEHTFLVGKLPLAG